MKSRFTVNETLFQKSPEGRWKCSEAGQGEEVRGQEKSLFQKALFEISI